MTTPFGVAPLGYQGLKEKDPPDIRFFDRAPTTLDFKLFDLGDIWIDQSSIPPDVYMLTDKQQNIATWSLITAGAGVLNTLTSDGGLVSPVAGNIDVLGNAAQGVSTTTSGAGNLGVTVADATTVSKGVAQFNPADFSVAAGIVSALGTSVTWIQDAASPVVPARDEGHIPLGLQVTYNLPGICAVGDTIRFTATGIAAAGGFILQAAAGQTIRLGNASTTPAGTLSSILDGDSIEIVCIRTNVQWNVISSIGNFALT